MNLAFYELLGNPDMINSEVNLLISPETKKQTALSIRDELIDVPGFQLNGNFVWGATAMILNEFIDVLQDAIASANLE